jgi:hypothetical protein
LFTLLLFSIGILVFFFILSFLFEAQFFFQLIYCAKWWVSLWHPQTWI